jgi:hypothetical protein
MTVAQRVRPEKQINLQLIADAITSDCLPRFGFIQHVFACIDDKNSTKYSFLLLDLSTLISLHIYTVSHRI